MDMQAFERSVQYEADCDAAYQEAMEAIRHHLLPWPEAVKLLRMRYYLAECRRRGIKPKMTKYGPP